MALNPQTMHVDVGGEFEGDAPAAGSREVKVADFGMVRLRDVDLLRPVSVCVAHQAVLALHGVVDHGVRLRSDDSCLSQAEDADVLQFGNLRWQLLVVAGPGRLVMRRDHFGVVV